MAKHWWEMTPEEEAAEAEAYARKTPEEQFEHRITGTIGVNAQGKLDSYERPEDVPPIVTKIVDDDGNVVASMIKRPGQDWVVEPGEGCPPWED
jgi:hypothetical protein